MMTKRCHSSHKITRKSRQIPFQFYSFLKHPTSPPHSRCKLVTLHPNSLIKFSFQSTELESSSIFTSVHIPAPVSPSLVCSSFLPVTIDKFRIHV